MTFVLNDKNKNVKFYENITAELEKGAFGVLFIYGKGGRIH